MKQRIENFGTSEKTEQAYQRLMAKFDRLDRDIFWLGMMVAVTLGLTLAITIFG